MAPELEFATEKPVIPYDPEAAQALLAEAGDPDGIKMTLVASDRPGIRVQTAIALKQSAAAGGYELTIETMPRHLSGQCRDEGRLSTSAIGRPI